MVKNEELGQMVEWESTSFLDANESVVASLNAALEDGNQELFIVTLGNIARATGMTQLAKHTGITRDGLYKALSPQGNPTLLTVCKVLKALNFELHIGASQSKEETYNVETEAAMKEALGIIAGKKRGKIVESLADLDVIATENNK